MPPSVSITLGLSFLRWVLSYLDQDQDIGIINMTQALPMFAPTDTAQQQDICRNIAQVWGVGPMCKKNLLGRRWSPLACPHCCLLTDKSNFFQVC